jgi:hypothetical protein
MNFYLVARWWTRKIIWRWFVERLREAVRRKKRSIVKRGKLVALPWRRSSASLLTDSWFSHPKWEDARTYHSVHTRQTLHQQTSFSSPSWNPCWREDDLSLSRKLKKIRWYSYAVFQKRHSRNVSKMEETLGAMYKSKGEHFQRDRAQ